MKWPFCRRWGAAKVFSRRKSAPAKAAPPYGVLIGRMIFSGGLALVILGLAFLVMLGLAEGSLAALLIFGLIAVGGVALCWLAARMPAPKSVRITTGVVALPPNM